MVGLLSYILALSLKRKFLWIALFMLSSKSPLFILLLILNQIALIWVCFKLIFSYSIFFSFLSIFSRRLFTISWRISPSSISLFYRITFRPSSLTNFFFCFLIVASVVAVFEISGLSQLSWRRSYGFIRPMKIIDFRRGFTNHRSQFHTSRFFSRERH